MRGRSSAASSAACPSRIPRRRSASHRGRSSPTGHWREPGSTTRSGATRRELALGRTALCRRARDAGRGAPGAARRRSGRRRARRGPPAPRAARRALPPGTTPSWPLSISTTRPPWSRGPSRRIRAPSAATRSFADWASGATGVVYLARDPSLGRHVALKLLSPHLSHDATASAASPTRHGRPPGSTIRTSSRVHEIGRSDDDRLFIAMAYHEGETLRDRIARGALPVAEAVRIAGDVADGLSAAHAQGIVHRDIKPENILLTARGACIVDFGIAKVAGETPHANRSALGTAAYMSPEQTRGDRRRPSRRSLVARRGALRDAHRPAALSRRRQRGAHLRHPARCRRAGYGPRPGRGSGGCPGGGSLPREGAGAPVPVGGRGAVRARPRCRPDGHRARQAVAAHRADAGDWRLPLPRSSLLPERPSPRSRWPSSAPSCPCRGIRGPLPSFPRMIHRTSPSMAGSMSRPALPRAPRGARQGSRGHTGLPCRVRPRSGSWSRPAPT